MSEAATDVLLVMAGPGPVPRWSSAAGEPLSVARVAGVAAAAEHLRHARADVVVVDVNAATADAAALQRLRENLGGAALLVRAVAHAADTADVLRRLGGAACVLPADAPAEVEGQVVGLAAERARLTGALRERVAELECRSRELEESRSRFRDVIERNADAIVVVDHKGVVRFANAMAGHMFGGDREDLYGTDFGFPVLGGETTELDLLGGAEPRTVEMRVVESEWEGQPAFIASLRDITERKRAEEGRRRLIREQAARTAAEAAAARFRFLAEASTLLSLPLDSTETLATLARLAVSELADWAAVFIVDEDGRVRRLDVVHGDPARNDVVRAMREHVIQPGGRHPVLEVLRTRRPLLVNDVTDQRLGLFAQDEDHLELIRQLGTASFMLVPLIARDRELGALALVSADAGRQFSTDDLAAANDLALRAALAVDNARLYQEAQRANQAKSDLLALISHDLRTPLSSIMGHADLLALGIPEPLSEPALQRVERIRTGASHLLYLIDQLLSFARLEAGREQLRIEQVDACALAHDVADVVEPLALARCLQLHLELPGTALTFATDPDRLRQVMLNLVGNAIRYTDDGEIRIRLAADHDGSILLQVSDTGIGIPPEHLERIFEPFWQVAPARRGPEGGTGLGLSVVRRIVRLLGGDITVASGVGRGSTFTVRLPQPASA